MQQQNCADGVQVGARQNIRMHSVLNTKGQDLNWKNKLQRSEPFQVSPGKSRYGPNN